MTSKLSAFLVLLFALGGSVCARAQLTLLADSYISPVAGRTTVNFGTQSNLYVGSGNTAFLLFDTSSTSSLPAGITASQIARATLTVFVNRIFTAGAVSLAPVTSTWSESSVTYAQPPTTGAVIQSVTPTQAGQYITFDVTSVVQGWVGGTANNGLALTSANGYMLLDSKENDQTGHAARLDVTVTSVGPQGVKGDKGDTGSKGDQGTAGTNGAPGATGAGYFATSNTSNQTIGTGTKTFTTQAGMAYVAGARVRAINANSTANYLEGVVTSYSGTTLVLNADSSVGSGTPTQWAFSIAGVQGQRGDTGAQGNTGQQGATGATGSQGPSGPTGNTGAPGGQVWSAVTTLPSSIDANLYLFSPSGQSTLTGNTGAVVSTVAMLVPIACTASNLKAVLVGASGDGSGIVSVSPVSDYTIHYDYNYVRTALQCTLTNTDASSSHSYAVASCLDTAHSLQLAAGSYLSLIIETGTTAALPSSFANARLLVSFLCN